MKTVVSIPDDTFARASQRAEALGMSRSELFTRAVVRYLDEMDRNSLTQQIDQVSRTFPEFDGSADAVDVGHRTLTELADEW